MERTPDNGIAVMSAWWYRNYVLGVLFLSYAVNVMDRSSVLAVSLQSIKLEFGASDTQLGLLTGIAFALFFSTFGIPIAALADRSSRRNVLAVSIAVWSGMTALCGMAVNFTMLFATRVGTAIGEAGGTPPSHSLISDYFRKNERGRAFAIFALGVPFGTALGNFVAGQAVQAYGWRTTFMLVGLPGLLVAALVALTVKEPPRGLSDHAGTPRPTGAAPGLLEALSVLWRRPSFRHLCFASALHAVVWYASSAFNAAFLIRSHQMTAATAANWLTLFAVAGGMGTLIGGYLSDRLSVRTNDKRWYLWVPAAATLGMVPFQLVAYLSGSLTPALQAFAGMTFLSAAFFGPSITMTQALATLRMRSVASSLMLFVQTMIGYGLGPLLAGYLSDRLAPAYGTQSLRYALALIACLNVWAALHYSLGTRTLQTDLALAEEQCQGGKTAAAATLDPVNA
jgi:MFS family permease